MTIPQKDLDKYGFTAPPTPNLSRIILGVYAKEKNGKSHFALTAPTPHAYFDFDKGIERPLRNFDFKPGQLVHTTYDVDPKAGQDVSKKTWLAFDKAYRWALTSGHFRTVTVDTGSACWELLRLAQFGKLTQVKAHHYVIANAMYRTLLEQALSSANNTNLILLHKYKKEYKQNKKGDDSWTGAMEPKWFNETGYLVEMHGELYKDRDRNAEGAGWNFEVKECGINPELEGYTFTTTYDGEVEDEYPCNFPTVAAWATGTEVEDWL